MAAARYDAVVIGGGHNGLVAAASLAKAKQRVLVVEASERLGGLAAARAIAPGVQAPAGPACLHLLSPQVARHLDLARFGLRLVERAVETVALRPGEPPLPIVAGDAALIRVAPRDAERLPGFEARLARLATPLGPSLDRAPPRLHAKNWSDRLEHLKLAYAVRRLGRRDMRDLLRIVAMNAADLAEEVFTHPTVQGAIAFDAVLGHGAGPRSPGTVFNLLRRWAGHAFGRPGTLAMPQGGMGAVIEAIASAARAAGVEIRTRAPAARIHVTNAHVEGLALASGEEIATPTLLSSADPRRTLLDLLGPSHLDTELVRELRHLRGDGINAKVNLVLGALPDFGLPPERLRRARLVLAPSLAQLEKAHDIAKYGGVPDEPALEAVIPTLADPTLAPPGKHLLSITVQYTPRRLANDDWAARRDALGDRVTALLDDCAPGLSRLVETREVLTPLDIEREAGTDGGHWHHVEAGLDRTFWLRPVPQLAQYRTPLDGLYLCGAGTHPGGGLSGAAGANAAHAALADSRRPRR